MWKYTLRVDGMMCGMCEVHINDVLRRAFQVKKVTSSLGKGETVLITEEELDEQALRKTIDATGYRLKGLKKEPYQKKRLFGF